MNRSRLWIAAAVAAVALSGSPRLRAGEGEDPSVVKVTWDGHAYRLLRDGKPYFIKGAGGDGSLALLADSGGNSVRTWGSDDAHRVLDEAQAHGLTVTLGIWLGHERHGFDYNDADAVARQYEEAEKVILRYKDHPALLLWGIGNEMEGDGSNAAVWSAVNNIASMAGRLDPNHPTMAVIAEVGGAKVKNLHRLCPDVDIVGINSYGGAATVPARYKKAGGFKPYVLTEYGPAGQWEIEKTSWGAAPEPTSTQKAEAYRRAYRGAIADQPFCLGGYAFLWGHKQEVTATWFGLLLPDGARTAAVDALSALWTGREPADLCPTVEPLMLDGPAEVEPGATVRVALSAEDPEGEPLSVDWTLRREGVYGQGGDREAVPDAIPDAITTADATHAGLVMPEAGGGYRLSVVVRDDHGGAATANVPLLVDAPVTRPDATPATLPLVVYGEAGVASPFVPSGWMGNMPALKVAPDCTDDPHSGKTCFRIDYNAAEGWAGIVWQNPPNDWGDAPGGLNLDGARRLSFWARGAEGGEIVTFKFGLYGPDKPFPDTADGLLDSVALARDWTRYTIDLADKDLRRIKSGFCWVLAAEGRPITFFLDDIRYE